MSDTKSIETLHKWNIDENKGFRMKIAIYTENLLNENHLNKYIYYLIIIYSFLYELNKVFQIIQLVFYNSKFNVLFPDFQNLLDYIALENYININQLNEYNCFFIFSILLAQLLLSFSLVLDFFKRSCFYKEKSYKIHIFLANLVNITLYIFSFSLNYLNLIIFCKLSLDKNINILIFLLNALNFIVFHSIYLLYIYIYNDISPTKNKYLFSVSNPLFHILIFFKFYLYNLSLCEVIFLNNFTLIIFILTYVSSFLIFVVKKVYIVNLEYFCITIIKANFFLIYMFINTVIFYIKLNIPRNNLFYLIISSLFTFISVTLTFKWRKQIIYKVRNTSDNQLNSKNELNELFVYHLMPKKQINFYDLNKHQSICSIINLEECICKKTGDINIYNEEVIKEIKLNTCLIYSKVNKNSFTSDLIYFNQLLDGNNINQTLLLNILNFPYKKIHLHKYHLIIRNLKKFSEIFNDFYDPKRHPDIKVSMSTINNILNYEYLFRTFLKNISNSLKLTIKLWEEIKKKPIQNNKFFKYGTEISKSVISISQQFGEIQSIIPNKINLLKSYAFFVKAVINSKEYVDFLINLISENLQIFKLNNNILSNYTDNDFGLLTISGDSNKLFRILSLNKYSNHFFGRNINLKYQTIHNLQPFPFNVIHHQYLKNNLKVSVLSREIELFCLDQQGDLKYITANIIPCMKFDCKFDFFMIYYVSEENLNKSTALVDMNGCIFAATKNIKDELNLRINRSFQDNTKLLEKFSNLISMDNLKIFNFVEIMKDGEDTNIFFPYIYDYIEEIRFLFSMKKESNNNIQNYLPTSLNEEGSLDNDTKSHVFKLLCRIQQIQKKKLYHKKSMFLNNKIETNISTSLPHLDLNTSLKINKEIEIIKKEDIIKNNKSFTFNKVIEINNVKYDLTITEKVVLQDYFKFFVLEIKTIKLISLTKNIFKLYDKTSSTIALRQFSLVSKGFTSSSIYSDGLLDNRNNISTFLNNYQQGKDKIISPTKIFKKIYTLYALIIASLIIVSLYISFKNLSNYQKYIDNCNIFNGFQIINYKLILLLMNVEYLAYYRYKIYKNSSQIFQKRINYTMNSLSYDVNSLENFIQTFVKEDYSSYPEFQNIIDISSIRISYLMNNNKPSYTNYTFYQALHIFGIEVKEFMMDEKIQKNYSHFNGFFLNDSTVPISYEKHLYFLSYNYFSGIRNFLDKITQTRFQISLEDLEENTKLFNIQNLVFCSAFLLLMIILFIILRDVHIIDNHLIEFYSQLDDEYIDQILDFIKKNKQLLFSLDLKAEKVLINENKFVVNKYLKNVKYTKKRSSIDGGNPNNNKFDKGLVTKDTFNTNNNVMTSVQSNTEANLLNNEESKSTFVSLNKTESKEINLSKTEIIYKIYDGNRLNSFYIKKFIKGLLVSFTLWYFYAIQVFIHPYSSQSVSNYFDHQNLLYKQTVVYNLIAECLLSILGNNNTLVDENNQDLFNLFYNQIVISEGVLSNLNQDKLFYNINIQQKIKSYNSLEFCDYFFNNTKHEIELSSEINYDNCISSAFHFGIQIYLFQMKNSFFNIYNSFRLNKNRTINYLNEIMESNSINLTHFFLNFYLRFYRDDIQISFWNSFILIVNICCLIVQISLVVYLVHISFYTFLIIFYYSKKTHFHFEKKRILLSILPRDNKSSINIHINNLLNKYF